MTNSALKLSPPDTDDLVAPSAEVWLALSKDQRDDFLRRAVAALEQQREMMAEGRPHARSKMGITQVLGDFFERTGRRIYLANELNVSYPGERVFAPDLLAVLDVDDPGDRDVRTSWVVAEEGKGLDLVLEILYLGDRKKDLFTNVLDYARMGITEYFVYDRLKQSVFGYRLPHPDATRYQAIPTRGGRLRSEVLGLELVVVDGGLRFFYSEMRLPESRELLARANAMLDDVQRRLEAEVLAHAEADERVEAERARANAEAAARAALELRVAELLARLGEG